MAELYLDIVRDQLNASSYPATEAGLNFGLGASARGLAVNVAGYSDRQPVLLRDVLDALKQPDWNQSRFDQLKQKLVLGFLDNLKIHLSNHLPKNRWSLNLSNYQYNL